jgi:hypothetical protein
MPRRAPEPRPSTTGDAQTAPVLEALSRLETAIRRTRERLEAVAEKLSAPERSTTARGGADEPSVAELVRRLDAS